MPQASSSLFQYRGLRCALATTLAAGLLLFAAPALPGTPVLTFTPTTPTRVTLGDGETRVVEYRVTNRAKVSHAWTMRPVPGLTQKTGVAGECRSHNFRLTFMHSCLLTIEVTAQPDQKLGNAPLVCMNATTCYQPASADLIQIIRKQD